MSTNKRDWIGIPRKRPWRNQSSPFFLPFLSPSRKYSRQSASPFVIRGGRTWSNGKQLQYD
ncbi:hypothetical protein PGTUg99_001811 [Puccinia graminis f. sp. tritici]|uniref:Uncharacterized protein n=1 Tax=Puccinia graminis f. sp. tritici TaxID=56615 RepID=A0A5B0SFA0_PUCGR|nr:hypothetical protein PGTUg99_001811 [Puccinia graminis f. sp. tritici]